MAGAATDGRDATDGTDGEVVELVRRLIRNACVSEGIPSTGEEIRNAEDLLGVLEGCGADVALVPLDEPGRPALVARLEGNDPDAPSLTLMGHTDVVPADPEGWRHDPFGGELIDGEVWGRGAVDMLNQTAAMALAFRRLARSGRRPRGTLVYAAVPDEECGGRVGAKPLVERHPDLVVTDYALTEVGGAVDASSPAGPRIEAYVAEKGVAALWVTVRGTPAHASIPWGTDNALVKAAEVVQRLEARRPATRIGDAWRGWVDALDPSSGVTAEQRAALVDPDRLWDALGGLPPAVAAKAHACTHTTIVPTMVEGGDKITTVPGRVSLTASLRPVAGEDVDALRAELQALLADLVAPDDVVISVNASATSSPVDTPLWSVLSRVATAAHPGAVLVPSVLPASTDARWLRPAGVTVYGFGVLSRSLTPEAYWARFHGRDERVDVESLTLSARAWHDVAQLVCF